MKFEDFESSDWICILSEYENVELIIAMIESSCQVVTSSRIPLEMDKYIKKNGKMSCKESILDFWIELWPRLR